MTLETFFEKFDQFADAPDAVTKLRELVLDLAIQGKLVEPKASDGDGHSLLKKLRTLPPERNSKSRSPKDITVEPETPLEIPGHWALTTVENTTRDTGFFCDGDWVESKDQDPDGDVRLIQLADVGDGEYRDRSSRFMTKSAAKRLNCSYLEAGDILVARMPDPLGRCCRFPGDSKPAVTVVDVCILRPNVTFFDPDFLVVAINCPRFRRLVSAQATGTTRSRISRSNLGVLPIPLPPLAEQKRIVAKVDELMALCDRLEAQQQERETRHAALARASLARFADAPTPANLPFLFHPSYAIPPADLRKSILTLAVQGKLVPQDPNDEPALALLDQIAAHKAALAKNGKLRGSTTVKPMAEDEAEFDLPSNWCWVRFGEIMVNRDGERIPVSKEERETKAKTYDYYGASGVIDKIDGYLFDKPLLLIGEDGANLINRSTPIAFIARGKYWVNNHAHVLDGISEDFLRFIELHINAINLEKYVTGSAQPKMNQAKMNSIPIALPPLAEQRRIGAKVEQLMALVDALETQLAASRATAANLLSALVAELTTPKTLLGLGMTNGRLSPTKP